MHKYLKIPSSDDLANILELLYTLKIITEQNYYNLNPLPHGVLASFCLTAGGLLRPPEEDDISREKTIGMT
jgi:hypothetical protein